MLFTQLCKTLEIYSKATCQISQPESWIPLTTLIHCFSSAPTHLALRKRGQLKEEPLGMTKKAWVYAHAGLHSALI